jgi:hypothetical protein
VDDKQENRQFDLERSLTRHGWGRVRARVLPDELAANGSAADPADIAAAAASAISAGAPIALHLYRVELEAAPVAPPMRLGAALDELLQRVPVPFTVVVFVSWATLPFVEALHLEPRSRGLLKIGITGARLDPAYTVAQKLRADGKLHYHEHTQSLERVLGPRLESMVAAHREREGS